MHAIVTMEDAELVEVYGPYRTLKDARLCAPGVATKFQIPELSESAMHRQFLVGRPEHFQDISITIVRMK